MTEENVAKSQLQLVEERKQYVLDKAERELDAQVEQCELEIRRKQDNIRKILLNLKEYVYQPCSDRCYNVYDAVTNIASFRHDLIELEERKHSCREALLEVKAAFAEAEAER